MWPYVVYSLAGRYFLALVYVIDCHVMKYLFLVPFNHVFLHRYRSVVCRKMVMSCKVGIYSRLNNRFLLLWCESPLKVANEKSLFGMMLWDDSPLELDNGLF